MGQCEKQDLASPESQLVHLATSPGISLVNYIVTFLLSCSLADSQLQVCSSCSPAQLCVAGESGLGHLPLVVHI